MFEITRHYPGGVIAQTKFVAVIDHMLPNSFPQCPLLLCTFSHVYAYTLFHTRVNALSHVRHHSDTRRRSSTRFGPGTNIRDGAIGSATGKGSYLSEFCTYSSSVWLGGAIGAMNIRLFFSSTHPPHFRRFDAATQLRSAYPGTEIWKNNFASPALFGKGNVT